jgi:serine protease AprX
LSRFSLDNDFYLENLFMKKISFSFVMVFLVLALLMPWRSVQAGSLPAVKELPANQEKLDQRLGQAFQSGDMITFIVTMKQQTDMSRVGGATRAARQQGVIRALQATSNATQRQILNLLKVRQAQGLVESYSSFWVFNGLSVTATVDVLNELAKRPDVSTISADDLQIIPVLGPAEPNVSIVNAPSLWGMGYQGQGIVVASMDSGVDVNHPDLSMRWRGSSNSWYDPYGQHPAVPTDLSGHGTQTMGVMVGGDAGGTTVGVAPGAQWIAVKIFNDAGGSTATAIHSGFQWLLDPDQNPSTADAPHVVNNSWTYSNPGCFLDFEPDMQSLRAAGILPIFAAGNGGPYSNTSFSPGNNPSAFAVGAINNNSQLYAYSSRGPTTCGGSTGPFPELVAPGVNIRTTGLYGGYSTASGTSLAAPHVAGGLALLLSAYPNLPATVQQNALLNSAMDLGVAGPDDAYGYGRLDIAAAFNWISINPTPTPGPTDTPTPVPTFTNTPIPTPTYTNTPSPTPTFTATPQYASTLHIGDLDRSSSLSGSKWNAVVTILVHNNLEQPVSGATLTGSWSNGATGTVTCTTNSSGVCTVTKTGLSTKTTSVTFKVTNATRSPLTYKSTSNHDPDGESNGTTIVVSKP